MSQPKIHIITPDDVDVIQKYSQLTLMLDPENAMVKRVKCRKCGRDLGCLANDKGVVFGDFHRNDHEWSRLVGRAMIVEKKVQLKCACGAITTWRQSK